MIKRMRIAMFVIGLTQLFSAALPAAAQDTQSAIFAGGCFWCVESDFEKLPGVLSAESGYIGGEAATAEYKQVSAGGTGHVEAVRVLFDPAKVSYAQLVDYFWRHIDPTVKDQQFCDVGAQYRTAIFHQGEAQKRIAEDSRKTIEQSRRFARIYTEIAAAGPFYPAEEYHQDYYKKNPVRYKYYRFSCGRDARVAEVWGKS